MNKFGIREVCNCTFEALGGQPSHVVDFVIDTAKMSTLESATTTVYAQGGQGHSRLIAWEGERNLTFTVEDALLTLASFQALTGASVEDSTPGNGKKNRKFTVYANQFAGYYKVTATTFIRDELGIDHVATIEIPKVKLQTTLNIPMGSSGDPSAFTFTFDAFPIEETPIGTELPKKKLFEITLEDIEASTTTSYSTDIIIINHNTLSSTDFIADTIKITSTSANPGVYIKTIPGETPTYSLVVKIADSGTQEQEFSAGTGGIKDLGATSKLCLQGTVATGFTNLTPNQEYLFVLANNL